MQFSEMMQRALAVRVGYAAFEESSYGRQWTGEELALGLVGDVGDLAKLVAAKEGVRIMPDVDDKLAHELADCLWSVIVLAAAYDVDLEAAFVQTMDDLAVWLAER
ncbi:MazG nucleotide pyrophosphohydrolase domain-containing protein [Chloroflexota bacterium]